MSDEPDSLILVYLRRLDVKMDVLSADMRDVKQHLTALEIQYVSLATRLDRLDARMERVERRLDIVPA